MKTRSKLPAQPQPTPQELRDDLLGFLQRKFYEGDAKSFAQDRSRLLAWVVLWPAGWLAGRGVSVPVDRYRQIFMSVFMEALVHGSSKVKYRPAWLRQVIQSHFLVHGDEIYEAAKSCRTVVEHVMLMAGRPQQSPPDPVREMARAGSLITSPKRVVKRTPKEQLSLF